MTAASLVDQIKDAMKAAMRARDKDRLGTIRLIQAEFKRIEVDERIDIDDARALAVLDKMVKQRRDSEQQYRDAGRDDLADREQGEIAVLQEFMPAQLTAEELVTLVDAAVAEAPATGMQAMGPVMATLKAQVQGRADMGAVSKLVKAKLSS